MKKLTAIQVVNDNLDLDSASLITINKDSVIDIYYDISIENVNNIRKLGLQNKYAAPCFEAKKEISGIVFNIILKPYGVAKRPLVGKVFKFSETNENPKTLFKNNYDCEWIVIKEEKENLYECLCLSHSEKRINSMVYFYDRVRFFKKEAIESNLIESTEIKPAKDFIILYN